MEPSIQGLRGPRTMRLKSVLRIKTGPGSPSDSRHPVACPGTNVARPLPVISSGAYLFI
jgi:hypothetical protein